MAVQKKSQLVTLCLIESKIDVGVKVGNKAIARAPILLQRLLTASLAVKMHPLALTHLMATLRHTVSSLNRLQ